MTTYFEYHFSIMKNYYTKIKKEENYQQLFFLNNVLYTTLHTYHLQLLKLRKKKQFQYEKKI